MRKDITIAAEARETRGKNEARRTRMRGLVPAVVYGVTQEATAVSVDPKAITKLLVSTSGFNTIFNLQIQGGEVTPVLVSDYQLDPIKGRVLHFDLKRVDLSKPITVKVPVHTTGDPRGVKLQGGLHEIITREVEIQCLPDEIPEQFLVDVADLGVGQSVRASEIPMTGSMKLISPPDQVISHVISLRAETTDAAAEGAATGGAEPEVIKKGKKEEEGKAGGDAKGGGAKAPAKKK